MALQPFKGDGPIVFPCPVDEMLPAVRVKYSNYDRPGAGPVSAYDNRGGKEHAFMQCQHEEEEGVSHLSLARGVDSGGP